MSGYGTRSIYSPERQRRIDDLMATKDDCPHPDDRLEVGVMSGFVLLRCSRCQSLVSTRAATRAETWAWEQLGEVPGGRR